MHFLLIISLMYLLKTSVNRRGSQQRKEDLKEPNRGKPTDQIVPLQFSRVIKLVLILELNMKVKKNKLI